MFKKALILGSLIPVLIYNTISYDLPYGTFIKPIKIKNYIGEDITFPDRKVVTTVLFFNIANKYHHNIISQINYLLITLRLQDVSFNMICVSKGDSKDFQSLNDQLHLQCQLINDQNDKISDIFNTSCNSCFQIFIIDKSSILRYFSSQYDPTFVREIVERYSKELI
jgi:hypothetical protein